MREILFRGKTTGVDGHEKGEWVYGNVIFMDRDYRKKDAVIFPYSSEIAHGDIWGDIYWVDSDTVDQFTGLIDKNGKKIFGGDIVSVNGNDNLLFIKFTDLENAPEYACLSWNCHAPGHPLYLHRLENKSTKYEIVGNIHDNPVLLEEK